MPTNQLSSADYPHSSIILTLAGSKGQKVKSSCCVYSILQSGIVVYILKQFKNVSLHYVILSAPTLI